jgi:acyl-CoA thioesterase-1
MRNLLIFCYFLFVFTCFSCRDTKNEAAVVITDDTEVSQSLESTNTKDKTILFFGDSLTAGMGLNIEEAFPAVIQRKIDSLGLPYKVINAGISGETTAGGKNRIDWVLNQKVDIFVLELGANDGLRGVPLTETRRNLQAIIDIVKKKNPDTKIILAGMQIPPNLGIEYTTEFNNIFSELAAKNNLPLIPFLLENVAGIADLNQNDGIHPTAEGHKILADNTWVILKEYL